MKVSAILSAALLAATTSAYRISLYSQYDYQGNQKSYTINGSHSPGFTVKSWIWTSAAGDGCCVRFCKGSTSVGYYCGSARNQESDAGVNKVVTGCGGTTLRC